MKKKGLLSSENKVVNIIIILIVCIIMFSQSFAISNNLGAVDIFKSVINHNSIYFLLLIYFVLLKFNIGKKYFNYMNVLLIVIYLIKLIGSVLTLFQSLYLSTILVLLIDFIIFIYLTHTMTRDTRFWKDLSLEKSLFNELGNDWYFDSIFICSSILLLVDLIGSTSLHGIILAILDYLFILLFARYIYLYHMYLEDKNLFKTKSIEYVDIENSVKESLEDIGDRVDDTIESVKDDIKAVSDELELDDIKDKTLELVDEVKDEAVKVVKEQVEDTKKKTTKKKSLKKTVKKETKKGSK